jgi:DNA-binding transcriptional LysR family regulator
MNNARMNFRTLDLNLLRIFDAVMAEGSLTRAAQTLAVSQSAVSHALKRLRFHVGEDLLTRSATGVVPTPRAEALWPSVREALGSLRHALAPNEYDPQFDETTFRLVMADATAASLMPPVLQAIAAARALASLRVLALATRDPRPMLLQGEVDLAVGYFPGVMGALATHSGDTPWRHRRIYETEYLCVMRRGHPLADLELTVDRFCAAQHLLVSFSGHAHGLVDEGLAALGRGRRIVLTVNQFFTAARIVTQSDLLTVLPAGFIAASGYRDDLTTRPLPMPMARVVVDMLWHLRHDREPAHEWLRRLLAGAATAAPGAAA